MARRRKAAGIGAAGLSLMQNMPVVIGLRLAGIAAGKRGTATEINRMVAEKVVAAARAQAIMAQALLTGRPTDGAAGVSRLYARKVAANRKRLSRRR